MASGGSGLIGLEDPRLAIERLALGGMGESQEAFWVLFDAAWPLLERFAKARIARKGLQETLAKDCAQNAFERVCKYRAGYRGTTEGEFWAWFGKICDNAVRTALQKERRHPRPVSDLDQGDEFGLLTPSKCSYPDIAIETQDAFRALEACMQEVDEVGQTVMRLRYWPPQLSQRCTAELLGCSPAQVFKLEHRSLKSLLKCLNAKGIEYADDMFA